MRTITISLKTLRRAITHAKTLTDDWQGECCEIALIPAIAKRYAELNRRAWFPNVNVKRHDGKSHIGMKPDDNLAVKDWTEYVGYVLLYNISPPGPSIGWNAVKSEYYCHSPSTCWDGMRRETVSQFIHDLRMVALGYTHSEITRSLERAKIRVTGVEKVAA